jgi:hypothetical protein
MTRQSVVTASQANRRRARRTPLSGLARVECRKGRLGLGANLTVKVLDLSETGVCLIVKSALKPGEDVELLLDSPGFPRPLSCPGEVVWSVALADGSRGIGVNFAQALSAAACQRLGKS